MLPVRATKTLPAFPSSTQNFRSHQVAEFPLVPEKKSHYGWMQGTDLTHNRWFLPASDKACFLQLITSSGNTHDVCFPKQILHSKPTCPHLPPSKGKNQVVQFLSKSVYFYLFSMEGSVCAKGVGGQSEGNMRGSILPFHPVGLRDQNRLLVSGLSWSYPAGQRIMVLLLFFKIFFYCGKYTGYKVYLFFIILGV